MLDEPNPQPVGQLARHAHLADPGQPPQPIPYLPYINRKYILILELRKHLEKGQPVGLHRPLGQHVTDDQPLARRHAEGTPAHRRDGGLHRGRPPGDVGREADHQHGAEGEADLAQRRHPGGAGRTT